MKSIYNCYLLLTVLTASITTVTNAESWPGWRGPRADGTSLDQNASTNWAPDKAAWKVEIPGKGHASPVVWGDYVYTATATTQAQERVLICLERDTGKVRWQQTVISGTLEKIHDENSRASSTPAVDGKRIYATFLIDGEVVVAAHDLATGKQLWIVRPGKHEGPHGFASEPVLYKDKVIVDGDSKKGSFLVALDRETGKTLWSAKRGDRGVSYSAPLIREMAGRVQLVQCGDRSVTSFDPETGKELWTVDGPSDDVIVSPIFDERSGLVFVSSAYPAKTLYAIRPNGNGNVTQTHVVWRDNKGAPHIPSMIVSSNFLMTVNMGGTAFCYEAANGNVFWQEKLGRHHASPVLLRGLAFFVNDDGQVNVIKPGSQFQRVGQYELGEPCYASPAISDGQVFVRGFNHLFCFGKRVK